MKKLLAIDKTFTITVVQLSDIQHISLWKLLFDFCLSLSEVSTQVEFEDSNSSSSSNNLDEDGDWLSWSAWSSCTRTTCGQQGFQTRARACGAPRGNGNHTCLEAGHGSEIQECNNNVPQEICPGCLLYTSPSPRD